MWECPKCHEQNEDDAGFCRKCKESRPDPETPGEAETSPESAETSAVNPIKGNAKILTHANRLALLALILFICISALNCWFQTFFGDYGSVWSILIEYGATIVKICIFVALFCVTKHLKAGTCKLKPVSQLEVCMPIGFYLAMFFPSLYKHFLGIVGIFGGDVASGMTSLCHVAAYGLLIALYIVYQRGVPKKSLNAAVKLAWAAVGCLGIQMVIGVVKQLFPYGMREGMVTHFGLFRRSIEVVLNGDNSGRRAAVFLEFFQSEYDVLLTLSQLLYVIVILLLVLAARRNLVPQPSTETETNDKKTRSYVKGMLSAAVVVLLSSFVMSGLTSCFSSSSGGSIDGYCQFEGCHNKAVGPTYEFCEYHKKMLNNIWDVENAQD